MEGTADQLEREGTPLQGLVEYFEINPTKVIKGQLVAQGAFGAVFEGTYMGEKIAIKTIKGVVVPEKIDAECAILCKCRHRNVVCCRGWCRGDSGQFGDKWIIMDFEDGGDLNQLLYPPDDESLGSPKRKRIPFKRLMKIAQDCAAGMNALHSNDPPIIHLDLKPANLLMSRDGNVKVADVGVAMLEWGGGDDTGGNVGTYPYMAPELMQGEADCISCSADVYSFGVVLWELVAQQKPWYGEGIKALCDRVSRGDRPKIPDEDCPPSLARLIARCWSAERTNRPTFEEIVTMRLLDTAVIEELFKYHDEIGKFWQGFCGHGLVSKIEWEQFIQTLCDYFKPVGPEDHILDGLDDRLYPVRAILENDRGTVGIKRLARISAFLDVDAHLFDTLFDLFSLGCVFFEMKPRDRKRKRVTPKDQPGTYCLRLNSRFDNKLTLCVVQASRTASGFSNLVVKHIVERKQGRFEIVLKGNTLSASSLSELLHMIRKSGHLRLQVAKQNPALRKPGQDSAYYGMKSAPSSRTESGSWRPQHGWAHESAEERGQQSRELPRTEQEATREREKEKEPEKEKETRRSEMGGENAQGDSHAPTSGRIVALGGFATRATLRQVVRLEGDREADSDHGKWVQLPDLPTPQYGLAATVLRGSIYALGGKNQRSVCSLSLEDERSRRGWFSKPWRWEQRASMRESRWYLGAVTVGETIFAVGGVELETVERYDSTIDRWLAAPSMKNKRGYLAAVASSDHQRIYALGGCSETGKCAIMSSLDLRMSRWLELSPMTTQRSGLGAVIVGDVIYAIGGESGKQAALNSVERYEVRTNQWQRMFPLTTRRRFLAAVAVDGWIYALGGWNEDAKYLSSVECYHTGWEEWRPAPSIPIPCEGLAAVVQEASGY